MKKQATYNEFLSLIEQGENNAIEFKSVNVRPESLAKELVAFSNSTGGVILLGVEDSGQISGIGNSNGNGNSKKNLEEWVMNIARNNVIPAISVILESLLVEDKTILFIRIPKGRDKPYQTLNYLFLIRVGSTNRVATQAELMRLFQQSGVFHYDLQGVDMTSFRSLNTAKIDQYFSNYQIDFENEDNQQQILINTDILLESGQTTLAGLLVFGLNPQKYLYNASISLARFMGTQIEDKLLDKQVIQGTLDLQIDTTLAIIKNHIPQPSHIEGSRTVDSVFQYPDSVFRELLVNACAHRDYSLHGSRIRIFIFVDRIEFISPGRLPNSVSIEKIKMGVSYARNPVIVKFLENLRYIDKLGRGLPMVYQTAKRAGKQIEFMETGEEFRVVLYF